MTAAPHEPPPSAALGVPPGGSFVAAQNASASRHRTPQLRQTIAGMGRSDGSPMPMMSVSGCVPIAPTRGSSSMANRCAPQTGHAHWLSSLAFTCRGRQPRRVEM
jgi:hypothetical protein